VNGEGEGKRASLAHGTAWRRLRALSRLAAFVLANLALAGFFFAALPFTAGSPVRRRRLRDLVFRSWARASLACTGVRVECRGEPPRAPCFLVSNHLVYVDIWVLAARTPVAFVAESGIERWPFFGFMARQLGIIFIDRARHRVIPGVNRRIEEALSEGHVIALFPEGRTSPGDRVLPFRSSLLEPAARGAHPVAWATIGYRTGPFDPPASEAVRWPDGVPIAAQARKLLLLDRLEATLTFGGGTVRESDRKVLAAELQRRVEESFVPLA
jgi:1-acyl-sn-glycerol-3-phosphate acyltransferase